MVIIPNCGRLNGGGNRSQKYSTLITLHILIMCLIHAKLILQYEIQDSKTKIYIASFQMALELGYLKGGYANFGFAILDLCCKITAICCISYEGNQLYQHVVKCERPPQHPVAYILNISYIK